MRVSLEGEVSRLRKTLELQKAKHDEEMLQLDNSLKVLED